MYLTDGLVINNGALSDLTLTPAFHAEGSPKPLLFVGPDGSGKTTILSIIADSLIEQAKPLFRDVIPPDPYDRRLYFRIIGGSTIRSGSRFSASFLRFEHNGTAFYLRETHGSVRLPDLSDLLGDRFPGLGSWSTDDPTKAASGDKKIVEDAFKRGVH